MSCLIFIGILWFIVLSVVCVIYCVQAVDFTNTLSTDENKKFKSKGLKIFAIAITGILFFLLGLLFFIMLFLIS